MSFKNKGSITALNCSPDLVFDKALLTWIAGNAGRFVGGKTQIALSLTRTTVPRV